MIGANIDMWSLWREPKTLRTPVCLARADLIARDPIGIPKVIKQNTKWYSPSQAWLQTMCHTHSWPQYRATYLQYTGHYATAACLQLQKQTLSSVYSDFYINRTHLHSQKQLAHWAVDVTAQVVPCWLGCWLNCNFWVVLGQWTQVGFQFISPKSTVLMQLTQVISNLVNGLPCI